MPPIIKPAAPQVALAILLLLLTAAVTAQTPARASATSQAEGNAAVTSAANAADGGAATVVAVGIAPSGEKRVVVDCRLAANRASDQLIKFCESIPAVGGGGNAPDAEAKAWRDAPACTSVTARGGKVVALDSAGRAWGREPDDPSGRLCAFRDDAGGPHNSGGGGQQPPSGREEDVDREWKQAPDCRGDPSSSDSGFFSRDYSGRAWGWQNGESCAWRSVKPVVLTPEGSGGGGGGGR